MPFFQALIAHQQATLRHLDACLKGNSYKLNLAAERLRTHRHKLQKWGLAIKMACTAMVVVISFAVNQFSHAQPPMEWFHNYQLFAAVVVFVVLGGIAIALALKEAMLRERLQMLEQLSSAMATIWKTQLRTGEPDATPEVGACINELQQTLLRRANDSGR